MELYLSPNSVKRIILMDGPGPHIDRPALVSRHNIQCNDVADKLALGNGEFCFTADGTGLQTFAGNCLSHWGWHSFPLPDGWSPEQVPGTGTFQRGRNKGEDVFPPGTEDIRLWMRDNPHRANLGRLRLTRRDGVALEAGDVTDLERTLDLWAGVQTSRFQIDGRDVRVETCVHPTLDLVAVCIDSPGFLDGDLEIRVDFPYPSFEESNTWVGDFTRPSGSTVVTAHSERHVELERRIDDFRYHVTIAGEGCTVEREEAALAGYSSPAMLVRASGSSQAALDRASGSSRTTLVCAFSAEALPAELPGFDETRKAVEDRWAAFWNSGGAIDLSESKDPRWMELERRIVLSQYLMATMAAGSWPPAEIGLFGIDRWRGRFHMEMVWWHLAHYALWDRFQMAQGALGCYRRFMPAARELAEQLGYRGLKWPKSVGPNGTSAPWVGNQVLLWKQPHPIFFAELDYRVHPSPESLEAWADIVQGTAEHMADYPELDPETGIYHLDPAMPPSEQGVTRDPVFDLAYWRWGLEAAQTWRQRLQQPREARWDEVLRNLALLPVVDGRYVHSAEWHDTYTTRSWEHPDMVGILGMLPPTQGVDASTAAATVAEVWKTWDFSRGWGWDFPWVAMAAARTGQPDLAVDALLADEERNRYTVDGLNNGWYLPGNGGLLYAVAMMAAGWDSAPDRPAPGFPDDGSWVVRYEGLRPAP